MRIIIDKTDDFYFSNNVLFKGDIVASVQMPVLLFF